MSDQNEKFLDRWSRLKQEQASEPAPPPAEQKEEPLPALPPVEELKPDSDFRPFMDPRVDGETRRAALKKLFSDAHFNVPDPFEAYSEDYNAPETTLTKTLKTLDQARQILDQPEKAPTAEAVEKTAEKAETPPQEAKDVAGKQDA